MKVLLPLLIFPLSVSPLVHAAPGDDEGPEEDKIDVYDPLVGKLSSAAAKTFHRIYPGHRIWKVEVHGKDKLARSVLTIFHPKSSGTHSQLIDGVFVSTPIKYTLVLAEDGSVIREDLHPVEATVVPEKARAAFAKWRRNLPQPDLPPWWHASQEEGKERLYMGYVILNSVHAYRATIDANGKIVDKKVDSKD
ncbi:MAG: hypothetical protein VCA73_15765 [Roseibacillus sp.]|jgi:hypothetical protein